MKKLILIACMLCAAHAAWSAEPVAQPYVGANSISYDAASKAPSDFELGGGAAISLSPHIAGVGAAWYGLSKTYLRGTAGFRVTATDVNDQNFSMGLGMEYQLSSKPKLRPEEWLATASAGWRPWPQTAPKVTLGAQGGYGLSTTHAQLVLAVRYALERF